jgi:hypothetical protein
VRQLGRGFALIAVDHLALLTKNYSLVECCERATLTMISRRLSRLAYSTTIRGAARRAGVSPETFCHTRAAMARKVWA